VSRAYVALRLAILPAIVALAVALAWRAGYFDLARREQLIALMRQAQHTPWAWAIYVIAYGVVATLGLPVTVCSVIGGALFGAVGGMVLAWTGAMVGTVTAYSLARWIGQGSVQRVIGRHHLLDRLRKRSDFWMLLRLRVLPLAPFAVLDYAAGLLGVSLRRLLLATAVGILPGVAAYAYAGSQLMTGLERGGVSRLRSLSIAGGVSFVMICISLVPAVMRKLKR
jgi:uncharacterized membrane protein YdjX (TVP38/TMEM64 family)